MNRISNCNKELEKMKLITKRKYLNQNRQMLNYWKFNKLMKLKQKSYNKN